MSCNAHAVAWLRMGGLVDARPRVSNVGHWHGDWHKLRGTACFRTAGRSWAPPPGCSHHLPLQCSCPAATRHIHAQVYKGCYNKGMWKQCRFGLRQCNDRSAAWAHASPDSPSLPVPVPPSSLSPSLCPTQACQLQLIRPSAQQTASPASCQRSRRHAATARTGRNAAHTTRTAAIAAAAARQACQHTNHRSSLLRVSPLVAMHDCDSQHCCIAAVSQVAPCTTDKPHQHELAAACTPLPSPPLPSATLSRAPAPAPAAAGPPAPWPPCSPPWARRAAPHTGRGGPAPAVQSPRLQDTQQHAEPATQPR